MNENEQVAAATENEVVLRIPDAIEAIRAETERIVGGIKVFAADLEITNNDEEREAARLLASAKAIEKRVSAARLEYTRPLDAAKKDAIERERELLAPVIAVRETLAKGIARWHDEKERRAREVAERIAREVAEREAEAKRRQAEADALLAEAEQEGDDAKAEVAERLAEQAAIEQFAIEATPAPAAPEPDTAPVRTDRGSVSTRKIWKYEIENPDLVPRSFCKPDPAAINRAVRDGARDIPGVRIFAETTTQVRTK